MFKGKVAVQDMRYNKIKQGSVHVHELHTAHVLFLLLFLVNCDCNIHLQIIIMIVTVHRS